MANAENIGAGEVPVLLDAPVSGGVVGAEAATLTFMVHFLCFASHLLSFFLELIVNKTLL